MSNIELNAKEINIEVCINILKMLKRRNLIDDVDESYSNISEDINKKSVLEIKLKDKSIYSIYSVAAKLSSIAQGTPLDEYLSSNIDIHKIVILKDAAKKVLKQIQHDYKNVEFFFEHEMLEDIPSKVFIPTHQLLNEEQKRELLEKFSENELPIIFDIDTMARYYHAKVGDIFRIIRPSITSGTSIAYRRVMHGSLDIIYS